MGNVLDRSKQHQAVALERLGWPLRRIEAATGVRRETVSGYLKAAGVAVRGRGRPSGEGAKPAISQAVSTGPPERSGPPSRAPGASACEPHRELIVEALGRGRNAMAIWKDLVDDHGFTAGYASVRRFVRQVRASPAVEARVVITTAPGEDAQADSGDGPMVRDPGSGKSRRTRLFVLTLGYSCKAVLLLVRVDAREAARAPTASPIPPRAATETPRPGCRRRRRAVCAGGGRRPRRRRGRGGCRGSGRS